MNYGDNDAHPALARMNAADARMALLCKRANNEGFTEPIMDDMLTAVQEFDRAQEEYRAYTASQQAWIQEKYGDKPAH